MKHTLVPALRRVPEQDKHRSTECFIDLGKLNLFKISLCWSKSVKLTVPHPLIATRCIAFSSNLAGGQGTREKNKQKAKHI